MDKSGYAVAFGAVIVGLVGGFLISDYISNETEQIITLQAALSEEQRLNIHKESLLDSQVKEINQMKANTEMLSYLQEILDKIPEDQRDILITELETIAQNTLSDDSTNSCPDGTSMINGKCTPDDNEILPCDKEIYDEFDVEIYSPKSETTISEGDPLVIKARYLETKDVKVTHSYVLVNTNNFTESYERLADPKCGDPVVIRNLEQGPNTIKIHAYVTGSPAGPFSSNTIIVFVELNL